MKIGQRYQKLIIIRSKSQSRVIIKYLEFLIVVISHTKIYTEKSEAIILKILEPYKLIKLWCILHVEGTMIVN